MDEFFGRRNAKVGVDRTAVQRTAGRFTQCSIAVDCAHRARVLVLNNSAAGDVLRVGLLFARETAEKNAVGAIAGAALGRGQHI